MRPNDCAAVDTVRAAVGTNCAAAGTKARRSRHKVRDTQTPHTPHAHWRAVARAASGASTRAELAH